MKREVIMIVSLIMLGLLAGQALAITGSIGNARMILRLEQGEEIEKYVLVRNVNDVPVDIKLSVSGDLEDHVKLEEESFRLKAGEEKKAHFTIKAAKSGTTETKINVAFSPEEGHGVGLSSTVVVIAGGESEEEEEENEESSILKWLTGNREEESEEEEEENNEREAEKITLEGITGAAVGMNLNATSIGLLVTTVVLAVFVVLLIVYSQKINKKKSKLKKRVKKSE